jgi:spermidine/putrescine transport system ATP-binding protein
VADFIGETNFLEAELTSISKGIGKIKLGSGTTIDASLPGDGVAKGPVTAVVRPEHANLVKGKAAASLTGKLGNVVYFGTDTHYHVALDDGGEFIVRMQNARDDAGQWSVGDVVGVSIDKGAVQVLRD